MKKKHAALVLGTALLATGVLGGCGSSEEGGAASGGGEGTPDKPLALTMIVNQVGEIPAENNPIEQAIKKYTNTDLKIQWIPASAYDDKINVMIAASELPQLLKVNYIPTVISSLKSGLFWEIGPYLKDYKNLAAQPQQYYDNVSVEGKIYGVPLFRNIGRVSLSYRKDWADEQGLQPPKSLDDWYNVIKATTTGDPDKNGKNDTYGLLLDKGYNQGTASTLTRLTVAQGGPNKWAVDKDGNFTPEFAHEDFFQTLKLFKRLYEEKLINQDFAVVDASQNDKAYESGRASFRMSGGNAQSLQTKVEKVDPKAKMDVVALAGPNGIRVPGESGNAGMMVIPKSSVKTEAEMKKVLAFVDKLMDPEMANLIVKGIEGTHYKIEGNYTIPLDKDLDSKEVKPYRDTLPNRDELYNIDKPSKDTELFLKNKKIGFENEKYAVPNPALTLDSTVFSERGKELEQQITDAQTKFIMGKIDEAGWKAEVEKWKKNGGDKMAQEYKDSYLKSKK
jgi:putative aldouronate transport system substrate-binding protein